MSGAGRRVGIVLRRCLGGANCEGMQSSGQVEDRFPGRPGLNEITQILDGVYERKPSHFPSSELFSEGWMLRLVLDWYSKDVNRATTEKHTLHFCENSRWFSEAGLRSPLKDDCAQADGVIGDFEIRDGTKSGIRVQPDAAQFVVVEAKMGSKLAKRTKDHREYDQVTRSILCACFEAANGGVLPGALPAGIRVIVVGPDELFSKDDNAQRLKQEGDASFLRRADEKLAKGPWSKGADRHLVGAYLDRVKAVAVSWKEVIDEISCVQPAIADRFTKFYESCCVANRLFPQAK